MILKELHKFMHSSIHDELLVFIFSLYDEFILHSRTNYSKEESIVNPRKSEFKSISKSWGNCLSLAGLIGDAPFCISVAQISSSSISVARRKGQDMTHSVSRQMETTMQFPL